MKLSKSCSKKPLHNNPAEKTSSNKNQSARCEQNPLSKAPPDSKPESHSSRLENSSIGAKVGALYGATIFTLGGFLAVAAGVLAEAGADAEEEQESYQTNPDDELISDSKTGLDDSDLRAKREMTRLFKAPGHSSGNLYEEPSDRLDQSKPFGLSKKPEFNDEIDLDSYSKTLESSALKQSFITIDERFPRLGELTKAAFEENKKDIESFMDKLRFLAVNGFSPDLTAACLFASPAL